MTDHESTSMPVEESEAMRSTDDGLATDVDALVESRDLLGLGAAADERRRRLHDDRVTFVRVQEVSASLAAAEVQVAAGAGELRLVGVPETGAAAVTMTERLAVTSGGTPVTGFVLDDLATLVGDDADALQHLLRDLRAAGLALVSALRADAPRACDWLDVSRAAGLDVARLVVERFDADGGIGLYRDIAAWGGTAASVHAFAPLVRASDERATTGYGDLRRVALARLLVDNIDSIQVDWSQSGPKLAQVALTFGADDVDAVSPHDDLDQGPRRAPLEEIHRNIRAVALVPVERNGRFEAADV